jgi:hypothetical protein
MTSPASLSQGLHGTGSRDYDWRQADQVLDRHHRAAASPADGSEDLVGETGIHGRTVRQILSDADGAQLLLGSAAGYFVCEVADDGDSLTAALRSQIASMSARVERRDRFALRLLRCQGRLW